LTVQPFLAISAALSPVGFDRIKDISGTLIPARTFDLPATLTQTGAFTHLSANIESVGVVVDFPAVINAHITPLALSIV